MLDTIIMDDNKNGNFMGSFWLYLQMVQSPKHPQSPLDHSFDIFQVDLIIKIVE